MKTNKLHRQAESFNTTDLHLAAFLRLTGCELVGINRSDRSRVSFRFSKEAEKLSLDYFNGAEVPAIRFISSINEVKTLIYGVQR